MVGVGVLGVGLLARKCVHIHSKPKTSARVCACVRACVCVCAGNYILMQNVYATYGLCDIGVVLVESSEG